MTVPHADSGIYLRGTPQVQIWDHNQVFDPKKPDREVPDLLNLCVDFEGGPSLMLLGSTVNDENWKDMIRGTKATVYFGGNGVEVHGRLFPAKAAVKVGADSYMTIVAG